MIKTGSEEFAHLIGKTVEEAQDLIKKEGRTVRVMKRDGKGLIGDCRFATSRVNVAVQDDKIVSIIGVG